MGVFYPQTCCEPGDMHALALSCGYPELGPVMAMSAAALDRRGLAQLPGAEHFTLLEILVTSTRARGRGVATGIVGEIMSECNYNINTNGQLGNKVTKCVLIRASNWSDHLCGDKSRHGENTQTSRLEKVENY